MIARVNFGTSVQKPMRYIQGPGRSQDQDRATLVGGNGFNFQIKTEEDVKLAKQLMVNNGDPTMQASPTKQTTFTALHTSLNWHPSQTPNQQEMLEAMQEFLKAAGMEGAMAVMHRHTDARHPHGHYVASLIDPKTGLAYDRYQFLYKIKHKEIQWENDRGQITPARQLRHDIARAAKDLDFHGVRDLLRKSGSEIDPKKVEGAISLGGHFGASLATYRDEFFKTITREPVRVRSLEPEQPTGRLQRRMEDVPQPVHHEPWRAEPVTRLDVADRAKAEPLFESGRQPAGQLRKRLSEVPIPDRYGSGLPKPTPMQPEPVPKLGRPEPIDQQGLDPTDPAKRYDPVQQPAADGAKLEQPAPEPIAHDRPRAIGKPDKPIDRWWLEPIDRKHPIQIAPGHAASGPQHDEPPATLDRPNRARDDSPQPLRLEPTPNQPEAPATQEQPRPPLTADELRVEHATLRAVLFQNGDTVTKDELDGLIKTGNRLGPDVDAAREEFLKSQGRELRKSQDESEPDRWWLEPDAPAPPRQPLMLPGNQDASKDHTFLHDGKQEADSADDVKRLEFIKRMERSREQFGTLTPSMRVALGQEPTQGRKPDEQPKPVKDIDLDPQQFKRVREGDTPQQQADTAERNDRWKAISDEGQRPRKVRELMTDGKLEPPQQFSTDTNPQRGSVGTGDLEDRTDQTAEGRRYIKRQKGRER